MADVHPSGPEEVAPGEVEPGEVEPDLVFRALADPSRRRLLDRLFERDGQTLGDLCAALPDMTRFGVMKHVGILEAAHLVVAEKHGRAKYHYLNPVPIRQIHDRWIAKYAEPFASALVALGELRDGA